MVVAGDEIYFGGQLGQDRDGVLAGGAERQIDAAWIGLEAKLKAAGVPADLTIYQGLNHGFIRYGRLIRTARNAVADCAAALKRAFR